MRNIQFIGYCKEKKQWVSGFYLWTMGKHIILEVINEPPTWQEPGGHYQEIAYEVEEGSIGQYSGVLDCKNKEIAEGDKVTFEIRGLGKEEALCYYINGCFWLKVKGQADPFPLHNYVRISIDIVIEVLEREPYVTAEESNSSTEEKEKLLK